MIWIVFFDGGCGLCSATVRRLARLDRRRHLAFAPLQGDLARRHGFCDHAARADGTLVVLRESDGRVFLRSDALIEIARALGGPWALLAAARWVPRPARDGIYRLIAANRHRLGAARTSCDLPDPEVLRRLRD